MSIWNQGTGSFEFHNGPVFANILLADEINRASPAEDAVEALLEVMQERRVTVDGVSRPVPTPFMVIATQNPIEQAGTYRLPEAQLDRFMLKSSIGYPDHATLVDILSQEREIDASELDSVVTTAEIDAATDRRRQGARGACDRRLRREAGWGRAVAQKRCDSA